MIPFESNILLPPSSHLHSFFLFFLIRILSYASSSIFCYFKSYDISHSFRLHFNNFLPSSPLIFSFFLFPFYLSALLFFFLPYVSTARARTRLQRSNYFIKFTSCGRNMRSRRHNKQAIIYY